MFSSFTVLALILTLGAIGLCAWLAALRWWDYLIIAALTLLLFPLVARTFTGDLSRYLPSGVWSEGAEGKDEIILVSIAATLLVAAAAAAAAVGLAHRAWRRLRRAGRGT